LIILVEHWFPWRKVLSGKNLPPRIWAYTLGSLAVAVPVSVVFWCDGSISELRTLWMILVVAGVTTLFAYAMDWLLHTHQRKRELQEHFDKLVEQEKTYGAGPSEESR